MQQALPTSLIFNGPTTGAAAWGIMYVVEGSWLGSRILNQRVRHEQPTAYLSARHEAGEWRALEQAIAAEVARHDDIWIEQAVMAAKASFLLYLLLANLGAVSA